MTAEKAAERQAARDNLVKEWCDVAANALGVLEACCKPGDGVDDEYAILDAKLQLLIMLKRAKEQQ